MKYKISIEMDGDDQWTCSGKDNTFGHTIFQKHEIAFTVDDDIDQQESLATALQRILDAVAPPRMFAVLAHLVTSYEDNLSHPIDNSEMRFVQSAQEVLDNWAKHDRDVFGED
ncbi:MAG TPA: hypothetical protein VNT76_19750 [Candidatus Binatus sp.]|nr:hypothetical protein [Candidatus Binatus sp.]